MIDFAAVRFVPRIVHQTYVSSDLPADLEANRSQLQAANPGWEFRFYDDAACREFVRSEYDRDTLAAYESIDMQYGACRADLFRYLLLYRVGGVYLDIKSSLKKPLDQIIQPEDRFLIANWNSQDSETMTWGQHAELTSRGLSECQQWHIICAPQHPYLAHVIKRVLGNVRRYIPELHGTGRHGVLRMTGPIAYTLAIAEVATPRQHRHVGSSDDSGLVYSIFANAFVHRTQLGRHYSALTNPIVHLGHIRAMVSRVCQILQTLRHWANRADTHRILRALRSAGKQPIRASAAGQ